MASNPNPSLSSYYVGPGYYEDLVRNFRDWSSESREVADAETRESCRRLLEREARFLEQDRHEDWLALFAPECLYWVPGTSGGGDPRREVAVAFDDRRRLEDRIFRLRNAYAWSQRPVSRTSRIVSNVTPFETDTAGILMVRSTFLITELQDGDFRTYAGWCGHRIRRSGEGWEILVKQVNLIDCDRNLRNPSITL